MGMKSNGLTLTILKNMNTGHDYIGNAHREKEEKSNEKMIKGMRSPRKHEKIRAWIKMERLDLNTWKPIPLR